MAEDEASFEVHLRDRTARDASSAAANFRKVHRAADGQGIPRAEKGLLKTERALNKTRVSAKKTSAALSDLQRTSSAGANPKLIQKSQAHYERMAGAARKRKKAEDAAYHAQRRREFEAVAVRRRQASAFQQQARQQARQQRRAAYERHLQKRGQTAAGLAPLAMAGGAMAIGGAYAAYRTGEATLGAVKFRDEALTGLALITRSTSEANRIFEESVQLADDLGQEWQTVVGGMQKLLAKGFEEDFAEDLTKGLADLKIVAPDANVGNLLLAIGQIKTAGKLQGDELNQLTEAGLNSALMFNVLQERLGKSREEVLKLKESGKLMADDVLPAILTSIRTMTGKELGAAAEEAVDTVAGHMRRLEQLPGRFFLAVSQELDESHLDGALKDLLQALDPESAAFDEGVRRVADAVDFAAESIQVAIPLAKQLAGGFTDAFGEMLGIEKQEDFFETWKDPETLAAVRQLGDDLGTVAGALAKIVELATQFGPKIEALQKFSVGNLMFDGGIGALGDAATGYEEDGVLGAAKSVVSGFLNTLWSSEGEAFNAGANLANAAESGMRSKQGADIHSPSRKTEKVGAFFTGGFKKKLDLGVKDLKKSGQELAKAPATAMASTASKMPAVAPGGGGRRGSAGSLGSMSIGDIVIPLSADSSVLDSPEAIGRAVRIEVQKILEGLVHSGGVADE